METNTKKQPSTLASRTGSGRQVIFSYSFFLHWLFIWLIQAHTDFSILQVHLT
jgi:hypothetical protein